jgi:hypothetical protein
MAAFAKSWRREGVDRPAGGSIQNGPRRLKRIKALHWQTPARGSFDPQGLFRRIGKPRQRYSDWDIGERQAGEWSSVRVKESK